MHVHHGGDVLGVEGHGLSGHPLSAEVEGLGARRVFIPAVQVGPRQSGQGGGEDDGALGVGHRVDGGHIFLGLVLRGGNHKAEIIGGGVRAQGNAGHRVGDRAVRGGHHRADAVDLYRPALDVLCQVGIDAAGVRGLPGAEGDGIVGHAHPQEGEGGGAGGVGVVGGERGAGTVLLQEAHVYPGVQGEGIGALPHRQVLEDGVGAALRIVRTGVCEGGELGEGLPVDGGVNRAGEAAVRFLDALHRQAVLPQGEIIVVGGILLEGDAGGLGDGVAAGAGILEVGAVLGGVGVVANELQDLLLGGQVKGLGAVELTAPHDLVAVGGVAHRHVGVIELADLALAVTGPHHRHGDGHVVLAEGQLLLGPGDDHVSLDVASPLRKAPLVEADDPLIVDGEGGICEADVVIGDIVDALGPLPGGHVDGLHVPVGLRQFHCNAVCLVLVLVQDVEQVGGSGVQGEVVDILLLPCRDQ